MIDHIYNYFSLHRKHNDSNDSNTDNYTDSIDAIEIKKKILVLNRMIFQKLSLKMNQIKLMIINS